MKEVGSHHPLRRSGLPLTSLELLGQHSGVVSGSRFFFCLVCLLVGVRLKLVCFFVCFVSFCLSVGLVWLFACLQDTMNQSNETILLIFDLRD